MFIYYWRRETKIFWIVVLAAIALALISWIIVKFVIFNYVPDRSSFSIEMTASLSDTSVDDYIILDENGYFEKTLIYEAEYKDDKVEGAQLTQSEVKDIFNYIVRKQRYFFMSRFKINNPMYPKHNISTKWIGPEGDVVITVKFNGLKKTIGGVNSYSNKKVKLIYSYLTSYLNHREWADHYK